MLHAPSCSRIFNIVGIDPGTNTLGYAVLKVSLPDLTIVESDAFTLKGEKLMSPDTWLAEVYTDRMVRLDALHFKLVRLFQRDVPIAVAGEEPHFNRKFPNAFGPLVETMAMIRQAVIRFDRWVVFRTFDAMSIKRAVGVEGKIPKGKAKQVVREQVLAQPEFRYNGAIPIEELDEHSIDALAIAYTLLLAMRNGR